MLSCIVGNKSVNSFIYEESKLRGWSNKGILRCPECGEKVIYCHGDFKIPYFRHEASSECRGNYSEPMTEEHIEGIKMIYNRLSEIDGVTSLEVEKYIKNTKQRPDIYFEYKNNRYCVEYQCSPISTQYNKRHELYELEGIKDIWILGTEKYLFENIITEDNTIIMKDKKVKKIEDEIDRGNSPLLYLNVKDNNIYKMNENGFGAIKRYISKFRVFNEDVLKTKFNLTLNKLNISNISIQDLTHKLNKTVGEICEITKKSIIDIEYLVKNINDEHKVKIGFVYELSNDRFPYFKTYHPCSYITYEDIYGSKIKDNINNYIERKIISDNIANMKSKNQEKILKMVDSINNNFKGYELEYIYDNETVYVKKWRKYWTKNFSYIVLKNVAFDKILIPKYDVDVDKNEIDIKSIEAGILSEISIDRETRSKFMGIEEYFLTGKDVLEDISFRILNRPQYSGSIIKCDDEYYVYMTIGDTELSIHKDVIKVCNYVVEYSVNYNNKNFEQKLIKIIQNEIRRAKYGRI